MVYVGRNVYTSWFWKPENIPKLGGHGVIVEMGKSYFPGKSKFHKGRRFGDGTWYDDEKLAFDMTPRGSLDVVIKQVASNRSRDVLLPIIDEHCLPIISLRNTYNLKMLTISLSTIQKILLIRKAGHIPKR